MQKVNRLGWAAGFALSSYGLRIGLRASSPEVLERMRERLPSGWKQIDAPFVERLYSIVGGGDTTRAGVRRFNLLYEDFTRRARTLDADEVFERFESDLRLYVAEGARRRVFVHAGAVGWRGKAIVIPGRSHTGKTTLVAELLRAGATYYSDEFAVFDSRGRVHPFLKPLSMRAEAGGRQQNFGVEHFGAEAGAKSLAVGLVLVSEYRAGARFRPRQLSAGRGILALMAQTVSIRRQPAAALAVLQKILSVAPVYKSARGEAAEVVDCILRLLDESE
jgi:hypothetical protein